MKRLITLLAAIVFAGQAWAKDFDFSAVCSSGQTLYYKITSNKEPYTVAITCPILNDYYHYAGYTAPQGDLVIPAEVENNGVTYSVTSIGDYAFPYCGGLTSVTIPESITSIDHCAFFNCNDLKSVTIPNSVKCIGSSAFVRTRVTSIEIPKSVTSIGAEAFLGCDSLTTITIPKSVKTIGYHAFAYCCNLTEINVEGGNTAYSSDNGVLFDKGKETLIFCPAGKQGIYDIPNTVKTIYDGAFAGCGKLTAVAIGNSVTNIGYGVFIGCSSLTSITIPKSVTSMGFTVFADCNTLIYCEVESIPEGWEEDWNNGFEVIWGYTPTPITETAANTVNIYAYGRNIVVENAAEGISVYDVMGRLVCRDAARHVSTITVNGTGVYIVKVGNIAKRVAIN